LEGITKEIFDRETLLVWEKLQNTAKDISFTPFGSIPLLLVIHFQNLGEAIEKINGHTELSLDCIKPADYQPIFSLLLDVEDGQKMVAKSTDSALKKFQKQQRRALTIHQSIALLTHYPHTLANHYMISAGTVYQKEGQDLPLLWLLDQNNHPELHYAWHDIAHGSYGAGSYAIKI
jgi:hypothetical protein